MVCETYRYGGAEGEEAGYKYRIGGGYVNTSPSSSSRPAIFYGFNVMGSCA